MQRCVLATVTLVLACLHASAQLEPEPLKLSDDEQKLLNMANEERKKGDLPLLRPDPVLFKVARAHAANMARQGKMEHKLDGKTPFDRIKGAGYRYSVAAENIARGDAPLADVIAGWMKSKSHRENLLERRFVETGLGMAKDEIGDVYYVHVFAAPFK
jgi:uncharacterized protein YkwD